MEVLQTESLAAMDSRGAPLPNAEPSSPNTNAEAFLYLGIMFLGKIEN